MRKPGAGPLLFHSSVKSHSHVSLPCSCLWPESTGMKRYKTQSTDWLLLDEISCA